jgi:exopolysaccharide biosynthesis polyprenyl glycosylphosphotransferase
LLSTKTWPWALVEALLGFSLFEAFAQFSPFSHLEKFQIDTFVSALVFAVVLAVSGVGFGLFEREARLSRLTSARLLLFSSATALSVSLTLVHFVFFMQPGRLSLIYGFLGAFVGLLLWHILLSWLAQSFPHRWFVLGEASDVSSQIEAALSKQLSPSARTRLDSIRKTLDALRLQRVSPEDFINALLDKSVSDLILPSSGQKDPWVTLIAVRAMQAGLRVVDERVLFSEIFRRYPVNALDIEWAMGVGFDIQRPITNMVKRSFDIALSFAGLLVASPVFLFIMMLIKLESPGPIFFIQERQGRHFRPFKMIKFRSMRCDREGSRVTEKSDARVTRVGALLRPLHLDELPQLWNIFIGDMSFVGPRPAMIDTIKEIRSQIPLFEIRQMIRPGLTGLAQISQGYSLDSKDELYEKLGFDLFYIRHYSLAFDLWIMVRTAFNLAKKAW